MSESDLKRRRKFARLLALIAGCLFVAFAVLAYQHAAGPRRYLEWRYQVKQGTLTEQEIRQAVGDDEYKAYREYIDSLPPLP